MSERSRLARWSGLAGVAVRRAVVRSAGAERSQTWLSVAGVAIAVALMLLVTSVGVGLAGQGSLQGGDYAIVPEDGASSVVADVDAARLGQVHGASADLADRGDVAAATPVRTDTVPVHTGDGDATHLLLIGVVPSSDLPSIAGIPTDALEPGDPHYASGEYDGPWTGDVVLSEAGADALDATEGDRLLPENGPSDRSFEVAAVHAPEQAGLGQFPVAVVRLSELQTIAGGTDTDAADQIVVVANDRSVEPVLEDVYPRSTVVSRGDLVDAASGSDLPVAIAVAAFLVAVAVGTLFTATTLGFELASSSTERAVMAAIGLSRRSRAGLVAVRALAVAAIGGIVGIALWLVGLLGVNALATAVYTEVPIASFRPVLAGYGLGVALLIGVLTLPYLFFVSYRTAGRADTLP